jgi:hypothetical protein
VQEIAFHLLEDTVQIPEFSGGDLGKIDKP